LLTPLRRNLLRQPSSRDAFRSVLVGTFVVLVLGLIDAWGIRFLIAAVRRYSGSPPGRMVGAGKQRVPVPASTTWGEASANLLQP
jgi:hypothetical protein